MDCRFLCPWNSPGKNTEVGCHSLLQGIFNTQGWNRCLLHRRQILYCLSHCGSPQAVLCYSNTQPPLFYHLKLWRFISHSHEMSLVAWHEPEFSVRDAHLPSGTELPAAAEENRMGNHTSTLKVGHQKWFRSDHLSHLTSQTCAWLLGDQEVGKRLECWWTLTITETVLSFFPAFVSFIPCFSSFFLIQIMFFTLDIIFLHWT